MKRLLAFAVVCIPLLFTSCAQSETYDTIYDHTSSFAGGAVVGADAPIGFVGGNWTDPHEQAAADITLADAPGFLFGLTDPTQVLPPPIGTFYAPWKLFVTAVRVFPFVTYSKAGEGGGSLTMTGGKNAGPLWYVGGPALEDLDSFVVPAHETVAADYTPVPGDGNMGKYWAIRANHHWSHIRHAGHTLKYILLNTNSNLPPYDNFFPDQLSRDKTTIHKTFDTFLFGFDWDDPYIN